MRLKLLKEMCTVGIIITGISVIHRQISSNFTGLSARDTPIFSFPDYNLSK